MQWLENIIDIIYPLPFTRERLLKIPAAPSVPHPHTYALFDYHNNEGKALVYFIKKHSSQRLGRMLSEHLHELVAEELAEMQQFSYFINPLVIPVPLSKSSHAARGFNQNTHIAKCLSTKVQGIYSPDVVVKHKDTHKQALVSNKSARFKNVQNCFSLHANAYNRIKDRDVIIVDDLITTGATLSEMKKMLLKGGARKIITLTIAH